MDTAVFSGRTDKHKLDYVNNLSRQKTGLSFGGYCANILVEQIYQTHKLPVENWNNAQQECWDTIHNCLNQFSQQKGILDTLSDDEIKELIAGRYE